MPNPSVGAVLVYNNKIIAEGFTNPYGGAHAEVNCIAFAKKHMPELIKKSSLYVSLEPCSHWGKTPPCADLIIESGIKTVIIGSVDPYAEVAGRGIKKLMQAGIDVTVGVLEAECKEVNKRFFTYHHKKRPYIILKWAETANGYIAPPVRNSQNPVWITNAYSRQLTHKWRSEEMAILVGAKTVIDDNPSLTTRDWKGSSPARIVLTHREPLDKSFQVFNPLAETIELKGESTQDICQKLYEAGLHSVLIEGGTTTIQSFIESNMWDEARIFRAHATFNGGKKAPVLNRHFKLEHVKTIQSDQLFWYKNVSH